MFRRQAGAVLAVLLAIAAASCSGEKKKPTPGSKEPTTTLRLELFRPSAQGWTPVACGEAISGVGNVRATGYAVTGRPTRIRIGYGATPAAEAWYVVGTHSPPVGVESVVVDIVQDLVPTDVAHTFRLGVPGSVETSCTINATSIPAVTEGSKSPRVAASDVVDDLRVDVRSYKSGAPLACLSSSPNSESGRLAFDVVAANSAPLPLSLHLHNEIPSANGPDQDGDPANRRFWEGAFFHLAVDGSGVVVATGVNGADVGRNTFHFGQQAATAENPTRVFPEAFCTITNAG